MSVILVTGSNGQLGKSLRAISHLYPYIHFVWTDYEELDITKEIEVQDFFKINNPSHCINCAAYTAVDMAENEKELAYSINADGAKHLANACKKFDTTLIHISTDFVFDGNSQRPFTEEDQTSPISIYGSSKEKGERHIIKINPKHFIIRTSWLYSEFGQNFVKTMLHLSLTKKSLNIVSDQVGSPTYAGDLAEVLMKIISFNDLSNGLYHYSNIGQTSWFEFAKKIFKFSNKDIKVNAVSTKEYPTLAMRPKYSVLNKEKITQALKLTIPQWDKSLEKALKIIYEQES